MEQLDVIIIGAGAAGLMAAHTLTKGGKKVIILEARNRVGGRIHTLDHPSFLDKVELGAEFIHGDLPVTLKLLKEANIKYIPAGSEMWRYKNGKFFASEEEIEGRDKLMENLEKLEHDVDLNSFFREYFPEEKYEPLRESVLKFVAGYDTADPDRASTFALRNEWQNDDENAQHRLADGYGTMIDYLVDGVEAAGGQVLLNAPVKRIQWSAHKVEVTTATGDSYEAAKAIVALPLGVLQLAGDDEGTIEFGPEINIQQQALQEIGFGAIIKILLRFDELFWEQAGGENMEDMGFLLTDEPISTWWTQAPLHQPVLTGWFGGPAAKAFEHTSEQELFEMALTSLSNIFKISTDDLKDKLTASFIVNWTSEPYTRGSYAYDTVTSSAARKLLNQSVQNTLYFAGEYLYEGPYMGTVEAALTSGEHVANVILKNYEKME